MASKTKDQCILNIICSVVIMLFTSIPLIINGWIILGTIILLIFAIGLYSLVDEYNHFCRLDDIDRRVKEEQERKRTEDEKKMAEFMYTPTTDEHADFDYEFANAARLVAEMQMCSIDLLTEKLYIDEARAKVIIDQLYRWSIISARNYGKEFVVNQDIEEINYTLNEISKYDFLHYNDVNQKAPKPGVDEEEKEFWENYNKERPQKMHLDIDDLPIDVYTSNGTISYSIDKDRKSLFDGKNLIQAKDVLSCELVDDSQTFGDQYKIKTTTDTGSMIGRTIAGAIIGGGVGAVIGATTASKTSTIVPGDSITYHHYALHVITNLHTYHLPLGSDKDNAIRVFNRFNSIL